MRLHLKLDLSDRRSFLDPHGGRDEESRVRIKAGLARAAIVDVARDHLNRFFVLDAWAGRVATTEVIDTLVAHWYRWRPLLFGIDSTAQQTLFFDTARENLRLRGLSFIKLDPRPASPRVHKIQRIRSTLSPVVSEHRLLVAEGLVELRSEIAAFPTGATVDLVDALAGAIAMFPPTITAVEEREHGDDQYREFLRECGLDEDEIESRITEEVHEFDEVDNHSQFEYP